MGTERSENGNGKESAVICHGAGVDLNFGRH